MDLLLLCYATVEVSRYNISCRGRIGVFSLTGLHVVCDVCDLTEKGSSESGFRVWVELLSWGVCIDCKMVRARLPRMESGSDSELAY